MIFGIGINQLSDACEERVSENRWRCWKLDAASSEGQRERLVFLVLSRILYWKCAVDLEGACARWINYGLRALEACGDGGASLL